MTKFTFILAAVALVSVGSAHAADPQPAQPEQYYKACIGEDCHPIKAGEAAAAKAAGNVVTAIDGPTERGMLKVALRAHKYRLEFRLGREDTEIVALNAAAWFASADSPAALKLKSANEQRTTDRKLRDKIRATIHSTDTKALQDLNQEYHDNLKAYRSGSQSASAQ